MTKQGGVGRRVYRGLTSRVAKLSMVVAVAVLWLFTPWTLAALASTAIRNGIAVLTVVTRVPDAIALIRQERERTAAEHEAFDAFARRARALDISGSQSAETTDGRAGTIHSGSAVIGDHGNDHSSASIEAIRDAYRETVMAVPHYEEEYDEALEEHLAQEFGTEIAIAVSQGDTVTPQLQQALVTASLQAREQRADLLRRLEQERKSLQDASQSLEEVVDAVRTVEQSLSQRADRELAEAWDRLEELEGDCRTLLRQRQCELDPEGPDGAMSLQEYLYTFDQWTYPVLGDGLGGIARIKQAKQRVTDTIYQRG